jgi:hypothetical protein
MVVVGLFTAQATGGEIVPTGSVAQPREKEIVDLVGGPMSQVFAKVGFPDTVEVSGAKSKTPKVRLQYGTNFAFEVREKKVVACNFLATWKGPLLGFKMWDTTDDIEKKLGKPSQKITLKDGGGAIYWDLDSHRELTVIFDSDHKCTRVDVETK